VWLQRPKSIVIWLGISVLIHGVCYWLSPQLPLPGPVAAPMEIGLRYVPKESAAETAPAPSPRPTPPTATQRPKAVAPAPSTAVLPASPTPPATVDAAEPNPAPPSPAGAAVPASAAVPSTAGGQTGSDPTPSASSEPVAPEEAGALQEAVPLAGENPPPVYPRLARQRGWEGEVALQVRVSATGAVEEVWVERSSGHGVLDQAALAAVKRWRFRPARAGVRSVAGLARVPIEFRLRGG
jgi:periplasmic protein TonB